MSGKWYFAAAALLMAGLLASCGQSGTQGTPSVTEEGAAVSAQTTEAETEFSEDSLFAVRQEDNGGKTFTILSTETHAYEFNAEEENGEAVNDAVYDRNRAVEELLGIDLNFVYENGLYENRDAYYNLVYKSVAAGLNEYDLVTGMISCMVPFAASGIYTNFYDIPDIRPENPWYATEFMDQMTIAGKLFCYAGDSSLSMYNYLSVIFANLDMLGAAGVSSPYALVRDGNWTLDTLTEYATSFGGDLNGDDKMVVEDDSYGLLFVGIRAVALQCAFDIHFIEKENGSLIIRPLNERTVSAIERTEALFQSQTVYGKSVNDYSPFLNAFLANRCCFFLSQMMDTENLRDMKEDYAILPLPKLDEQQEGYRTLIPTATQIMFVPILSDLPLTGKVIESMNYYSWKWTVPAYYDTTLSVKYSRDADTQEMLQIIRRGLTLPVDYAYSGTLTGINRILFDTAEKNISSQLASDFEKNLNTWKGGLEKIVEEYENSAS